jgi:hypothetical protein
MKLINRSDYHLQEPHRRTHYAAIQAAALCGINEVSNVRPWNRQYYNISVA